MYRWKLSLICYIAPNVWKSWYRIKEKYPDCMYTLTGAYFMRTVGEGRRLCFLCQVLFEDRERDWNFSGEIHPVERKLTEGMMS